jgi:hypothetical protein
MSTSTDSKEYTSYSGPFRNVQHIQQILNQQICVNTRLLDNLIHYSVTIVATANQIRAVSLRYVVRGVKKYLFVSGRR